jgi:hypothetical protein
MSEGQMAWFMPEMNKMQDEIVRLTAEQGRLRAALEEILNYGVPYPNRLQVVEIARRALEGK